MRIFIKKITVLITFGILVFIGVHCLTNNVLKNRINNELIESKIIKLKSEIDSATVIIAGDSRAERMLSPKVIYEETGLRSVNLAVNNGDLLSVTSAITKIFSDRNYLFILSIGSWQINDYVIGEDYLSLNCFQKMSFIERLKIFKNDIPELLLLYKRLLKASFGYFNPFKSNEYKDVIIENDGFYPKNGQLSNDISLNDLERYKNRHPWYKRVADQSIRWNLFKKSVEELGKSKSEFIIYHASTSPTWRNYIKNTIVDSIDLEFSKKVCSVINQFDNITFIDFYSENNSLYDSLYYDFYHLNKHGAKVFTQEMCNYIQKSQY